MKVKTAFRCIMLTSVLIVTSACGTSADVSITGVTTAATVTESSSAAEVTAATEAETTVTETSIPETAETETTETDSMVMKMKIGSKVVDVTWEDNASVEEIKKLAASGLTIKMSKYGGFEQVGSIGHSITSADKQTKTAPGDIVLYSGNQLVVFYGSNSWAYTRLGKINMSKKELTALLGKKDVTVTLVIQHT